MIEQMRQHLVDQTKARRAKRANLYTYTFEAVAAIFIFAAWVVANEGDNQTAGELLIYGIIWLAIAALFACWKAWLTTPPPEEPNI